MNEAHGSSKAVITAVVANAILTVLPNDKCKDERLRDYSHTRAAAQATLERTEIIVEELARAVKQRLPRVHHVTLEVEGIATTPGSGEGKKHG